MIRVVVDSGCDLTEAMKQEPALELVPLNLTVDDKQFVDDLSLNVSEYLSAMEASKSIPKTAAPSPELYLEAFKKEGSIFALTLSSKLSGSYNSAMLAKQMYLDEIGEKFIHVIDSLGASAQECIIALKLLELSKKNLSAEDALGIMNKFMSESKVFFILEKFDNLVKTGRMNGYIAKIASMLSIKVICGADDGNIVMVDKARGYKAAISRLADMIKKEGLDFENRILGISHVCCLDKALEMKNEMLKKIKFKDVVVCEASGLCTTYANRGGIVISY